jgi:hypothetical protein
MRIIANYIFILFVIAVSCNNEQEINQNVLSQDQMVEVITEIELTQAFVKLKSASRDTLFDQKQVFNNKLKELNISQEQFNNSLNYYCKQPKVLEGIYVKVINNLSEKQEKAR